VALTQTLLAWAGRWFDARTVSSVFEPLVADWQREWLEAPVARRRWVTARAMAAFGVAAIAVAPRALILTPTPPSMLRRAISRMIIFVSVVSGLMMIPFLSQLGEIPPGRLAWLLMWLLPSMALFAFPFAMGFVVDGVRRHHTPTQAERMTVLRTALIAVAVTVVLGGWIVPAANQQFRLTVQADEWRPPARGARELTTPQLIEAPWLAHAEGPGRAEAIRRELHNRASLAVLPLVLIWLRWRALNHPSPQWLLPAWLSATVLMGLFFSVRENDARIESLLGLDPGAAAWVPLALFLAIGWIRDHTADRTVTSVFHA
jgi:hypothetical protein